MPELPEVETVARDLRPDLYLRRITGVHVLWPRTVAAPDLPMFENMLPGQRIIAVGRRGKYVVLNLESGDALLVHLRMTGHLHVEPDGTEPPEGKHVRVWFDLDDGYRLVFVDPRKFGRMWLAPDVADVTAKLGPEPLDADFTADVLATRLAGRRVAIKPLLLDQTVVAGLGNIYADESLFLARLHPLRRSDSLTTEEIVRLHAAIVRVLTEAVSQRGTTLRDYRTPYGDKGNYGEVRRAYGRTDQPCPNCGTPIRRIVIGQRSAHFCPHCQPAERP
jgi:formamidopyrimidine-DNA glycosylase